MNNRQEKIGISFALLGAAMWGIFPVVVQQGGQTISPLLFAAITTLLAACGAFFLCARTRETA